MAGVVDPFEEGVPGPGGMALHGLTCKSPICTPAELASPRSLSGACANNPHSAGVARYCSVQVHAPMFVGLQDRLRSLRG